ncbi:ABC transporter permease [Colwellia sp. Arc7-D]|jgi:ABC-2 type transport system permease protein|uniref:ABC transporter permease n=1 Tax=Colwellia sp. Arc7-D TaxID=2161872 RepID=UPI000D34DDDB|nr:ABC transporter permease [Colwellia sp. Arc7-D]AWB57218.1 multidrug ABC transporter permease [Colwellia sp. Arc7-D]|tara:strand:+ start:1369 stop:2151 length:783 start_codon:yes stop_codon:yes gene_type:complete
MSSQYLYCFNGIVKREVLRFFQQRSRLLSALVRPLLWLVVFAAGFRAALGVSIMEPYGTYITYQQYITPGLCCMIILFNGMQSSLSMVYDREMGSMKVLLMSPLPRPYLLCCKLIASALLSLLQVVIFLLFAQLVDVDIPLLGYLSAIPAIFLIAFFLGALGLMLSNLIKQLENFAGVMNFVIFPMFFLSSALYPLWKMKEASIWLYWLCQFNPFTACVELLRFALYGQLNFSALLTVLIATSIASFFALMSFKPQLGRK